jgi:hypothetical protein
MKHKYKIHTLEERSGDGADGNRKEEIGRESKMAHRFGTKVVFFATF